MSQEISIKTAELLVSHGDVIIETGSIGSCIVIALYDEEAKIGGMAHAMLPTRKSPKPETEELSNEPGNTSARYADEAIDNLLVLIRQKGGKKENLTAKLIGGASMFKKLSGDSLGMGHQNTESARTKLMTHGIPIEKEDVGGSSGKMVEFNLANGVIEVNTKL